MLTHMSAAWHRGGRLLGYLEVFRRAIVPPNKRYIDHPGFLLS